VMSNNPANDLWIEVSPESAKELPCKQGTMYREVDISECAVSLVFEEENPGCRIPWTPKTSPLPEDSPKAKAWEKATAFAQLEVYGASPPTYQIVVRAQHLDLIRAQIEVFANWHLRRRA
jgi:hypothetical protein